jgi:hypothetical protein
VRPLDEESGTAWHFAVAVSAEGIFFSFEKSADGFLLLFVGEHTIIIQYNSYLRV